MSQHYVQICKQHRKIVAQCRCQEVKKAVIYVDCPFPYVHQEEEHDNKS